MKRIVLMLIGAAACLLAAGCAEEGHEHHPYGGSYDATYHEYGHEQWPGYPTSQGYWDRSDDWHPH